MGRILLEDGVSALLLEDGVSFLLDESESVAVTDTASLTLTEVGSVEAVDGSLTPPEQPSGGYGAANEAAAERQRQRLKLRERERWTAEHEAELAALLQARIAAQEAPAVDDLARIRALVAEYAGQADYLSRRGQRAIEYAQRAKTDLAMQLAAREIERFETDALAALLVIALDD